MVLNVQFHQPCIRIILLCTLCSGNSPEVIFLSVHHSSVILKEEPHINDTGRYARSAGGRKVADQMWGKCPENEHFLTGGAVLDSAATSLNYTGLRLKLPAKLHGLTGDANTSRLSASIHLSKWNRCRWPRQCSGCSGLCSSFKGKKPTAVFKCNDNQSGKSVLAFWEMKLLYWIYM